MTRHDVLLKVSALFGFAFGLGLGVYQTFTLDPMISTMHDGVPYWMRVTHIHILGLSLVTFVLSFVIDDAFESHRGKVAWLTVLGQWGTPLTLYPVVALGIVVFGPIHNLVSLLTFVVVLAFAVAYARSWSQVSEPDR
ncbi:hypothetical protein EA462_00330 [Natrarchaeobius halalkaliphilus]|uniref:DUF8059 domain-containing protein n=1 Tax=Natrarchaeobius halalkaliphilus TaxID=1679091 RepID=A0A3N6MFN2_9EURY|nr:hypothetical protein [Natrarchaeobius halalkaliphilus]RQG92716.1 hypothetical protein EA462_00330 [Natrarchaeobius halalkaliphilus]